MSSRLRDAQETRNAAEVMGWIRHLADRGEVEVELDLVCHINRVTLRGTERDYWAGRVRSEVGWQEPADWSRSRSRAHALSERAYGWVRQEEAVIPEASLPTGRSD